MFRIRTITDPAELLRFGNEYKLASKGVTINQDYLQRVQRVVVVYQTAHPDEFLGGYVINDKPPHRYFIAPGEAAKQRALAPHDLNEQDMVEIGAIWFKKYRSPLRELHRLVFFRSMLLDAVHTGRSFILGGSFLAGIQYWQRQVLPLVIYENQVTVGDFSGTLQLYVGAREGLWLRFAATLVRNVLERMFQAFWQKKST